MKVYLKYYYDPAVCVPHDPRAGKSDYIGPFDWSEAAEMHKKFLGPPGADIVPEHVLNDDKDPVGLMSPVDHYAYMLKRF